MQINSINTNQNQQSFKGVVFHNKTKLVKDCSEALMDSLADSGVKNLIGSKEFNLHIRPSYYYFLSFQIKTVGQGVKGFFRNLFAPWIKGVTDIDSKQINEYKAKYHPTPEDIAKAKAEKKQLALNLKRLKAERIANKKAKKLEEQELLNNAIKRLIDLENINKK